MVTYRKEDNIGIVEFDDNDSKVNLLSNKNLEMLDDILEHIGREQNNIEALFFVSKKEGIFIAGADIKELAKIRTREEALKICEKGQDLFNKIESLNIPTFSIIDGICVGGGLELALSCDFIIATKNKKVKIGFPEEKLGIVPGFGGTARLSKRIGLKKARELIETGRLLSARESYRLQLVNRIIAGLEGLRYQYLFEICKRPRRPVAKFKSLQEKNKVELNKQEREILADKILQKPAKNAMSSFLLVSKYKNYRWFDIAAKKTHPIKHCAVVGAGIMGRGIAYLISSKGGYFVKLNDTNRDVLINAGQYIKCVYKDAVKRNLLRKEEIDAGLKNISFGKNPSKDDDILVESITEVPLIKKVFFAEIDRKLQENCIITTNTSCISIEELSKSLKNAERFMGVHFFNPAYKMKLVEVVPTRFTSRQALQTVLSFLQHLGKIPIIVKDSPGFLVNRMLMPYLNEAIFMLEEGFLPDEIDSSMLGFGMPLGPFKLLKEIGPQVAYKASKILEDSFGDRMKVPKSLEKDFSRHLSRFLKKKLNSRQGSSEYIRNRLLEPIRREAGLCLKEGVVDNPEIVDLALLTGIGFPSSKRIWEF